MTDLVHLAIWLLLSSLVRQVENGLDSGEPDENKTGVGNAMVQESGVDTTDSEPYEPIVQIIKIAIAAFSLLLLGLSVSAYKKTALKSIIYAAIAFGLFAAQLTFDYLEDVVQSLSQPYNDVIFYAMTLAILVLFFTAIVRRK
jgi:hypothetical protein